MKYIKKVLMLRRTQETFESSKPLSVLTRIEIESGVGEFYISVINLPFFKNQTTFYAVVVDSNKSVFEFDLGYRPTSLSKNFYEIPSVEDGVAIGLYCTAEQIPITLAFASQGKSICLQDFKKLVADRCLSRFKQNIKEQEKKDGLYQNAQSDCQVLSQDQSNEQGFLQYNDEAVATENYYEIDDEIKEKLKVIRDSKGENLFFEDEYAYSAGEKAKKEEFGFFESFENEKDACQCQENKNLDKSDLNGGLRGQTKNYYDSVKDELMSIFFTYQKEENLEKIFNESKWAKIFYSKEKFYVVGLICQDKKEKYICYGVPARYSKNPPKELEGYCSFIPLSVLDMFGDGYFIMFQDAETGKCVHLN